MRRVGLEAEWLHRSLCEGEGNVNYIRGVETSCLPFSTEVRSKFLPCKSTCFASAAPEGMVSLISLATDKRILSRST